MIDDRSLPPRPIVFTGHPYAPAPDGLWRHVVVQVTQDASYTYHVVVTDKDGNLPERLSVSPFDVPPVEADDEPIDLPWAHDPAARLVIHRRLALVMYHDLPGTQPIPPWVYDLNAKTPAFVARFVMDSLAVGSDITTLVPVDGYLLDQAAWRSEQSSPLPMVQATALWDLIVRTATLSRFPNAKGEHDTAGGFKDNLDTALQLTLYAYLRDACGIEETLSYSLHVNHETVQMAVRHEWWSKVDPRSPTSMRIADTVEIQRSVTSLDDVVVLVKAVLDRARARGAV